MPILDIIEPRLIRVENRPGNEHIEVKVPALIDAGTFEAAQENLKESASKVSRHVKRTYLLRGVVFLLLQQENVWTT